VWAKEETEDRPKRLRVGSSTCLRGVITTLGSLIFAYPPIVSCFCLFQIPFVKELCLVSMPKACFGRPERKFLGSFRQTPKKTKWALCLFKFNGPIPRIQAVFYIIVNSTPSTPSLVLRGEVLCCLHRIILYVLFQGLGSHIMKSVFISLKPRGATKLKTTPHIKLQRPANGRN
jgi:hypothetical protein